MPVASMAEPGHARSADSEVNASPSASAVILPKSDIAGQYCDAAFHRAECGLRSRRDLRRPDACDAPQVGYRSVLNAALIGGNRRRIGRQDRAKAGAITTGSRQIGWRVRCPTLLGHARALTRVSIHLRKEDG